MRKIKPECIVPVAALGATLALTTACSGSPVDAVNPHNTYTAVANPNFVPQLQILGRTFLMLYNHSTSGDRSTPLEADGRITVAEVDVHIGSQVLKLTIDQLPSTSIAPSRITSLDILHFSQTQPLAGFDISFGRNPDGTIDASCAALQRPQGFSESHQTVIYDHFGNPLLNSSPKLAAGFLSDMLANAARQLSIASRAELDHTLPQDSSGDPCGVNFGY